MFLPGRESYVEMFLVRTRSSGEGSDQSRCFGSSKSIRYLCVPEDPFFDQLASGTGTDLGTGHVLSLYLRKFKFGAM